VKESTPSRACESLDSISHPTRAVLEARAIFRLNVLSRGGSSLQLQARLLRQDKTDSIIDKRGVCIFISLGFHWSQCGLGYQILGVE